jgi:3-dehydroquinate synthase
MMTEPVADANVLLLPDGCFCQASGCRGACVKRPYNLRRSENSVDRTPARPYFLELMSSKVKVELGPRSYEIHIGTGLLSRLGAHCAKLGLGRNCLVVSDSHVTRLYGSAVVRSLKKAGFAVASAVIPAGEKSKSEKRLFALYSKALAAGLDRKSFVVALDGGVVGDLAGFLAATLFRGIRLVQVPTSLLAMVDSSVGGKTGINLPEGKNLVGSFHQPVLVLADTATLKTLPRREYLSGLAEVIKYGVISDPSLFSALERRWKDLVRGQPAFLESVIARCCEIKADVVRLDERESGLRAILNFGHTIGHAIEQVTGYGKYLHGEAIAIGMVLAARLSVGLKGFRRGDCVRLENLLRQVGLPVQRPSCEWAGVRKSMGLDKKSAGRTPRFVLARKIGAVAVGCEVPEALLKEVWNVSGK